MNKTEIINYGLISLGQRPLTNPEILDTEEARIMSAIYSIVREDIASQLEWPCLIKISDSLDLLVENEDNIWQYEYELPIDFSRMISVLNEDGSELRDRTGNPYSKNEIKDWVIERGSLKSNMSPVTIKYILDPPDTENFPGYFGRPFGMSLAFRCSTRITSDEQTQDRMYQLYQRELYEGKGIALQGAWGKANDVKNWGAIR